MTKSPPQLQPPGAGLPLAQRLFTKFWLGPYVSKRTPWEESRGNYELRTRKIIEWASAVPDERRNEKVLVDATIRGLEDSSRYWSVNETLEHLLIVSRGMERVILALASGKVPDGKADTAKMKPKGANLCFDWLTEFSEYAPLLMAKLDESLSAPGMNRDSTLRFAHPWFGGITVRQWYWLLAAHQGIHTQQMRQITQKLPQGV